MNIFYLDKDPKLAAQAHYDRHVVKMPVESCQIGSYVLHNLGLCPERHGLYKPNRAHLSHPCTLWAQQSRSNFLWLLELAQYLFEEWAFRYSHRSPQEHRSFPTLSRLRRLAFVVPGGLETPPAQAFASHAHLQRPNDPVGAYRAYYRTAKEHLHAYRRREPPLWLLRDGDAHSQTY